MKTNIRKYIALVTLISIFMAYFIPAEGLTLLAPAPEIVIEVEEIDEPDISGAEKSDKEDGFGTGSAVEEKEEDNKDKPDSEASADTEKPEKEDAADKAKETDKPAAATEAVIDTVKPEELKTETSTDTEKPEELKTETPTETVKPEELKTEAPTETSAAMPTETAKPETEKETVKPTEKPDVKDQTGLFIASEEPDKWYFGSDLTIDEHFIFGEDRMYTEGKANRGFDCLLDNNVSVPFYVTTNDPEVNYQDLTGKEISVTFHTSSAVVIDHFKIISGGDTYKANYAHRSPTAWSLKAGNSVDSCDTVLVENLPVNATKAYEENNYEFDNTVPYKYYKFTVTALAGAGRSGHDGPFSNPTATCILADILIGGPVETHEHDNINFTNWTAADSLPTTAGNYCLASDVTISSTWNVPSGETKLCLNGHGIRMTGSGSVVSVGSGAVLNLYDCGADTPHKFDVPDGAGLAALNESSGKYTVSGGYITGGTGLSGRGGGVYVNGGTFTLTAGTIIGNQVQNEGGGVFVASGSFSMNGGAIIYNKSTGHWGGGINVAGPFTMSGGSISHNYAGGGAGGVHCHALTMTGGSVTDNQTASNYAGGVNVNNTATLSGNVNVSGNTNSSGKNNLYCKSVVISDKLSEDASIGITLPNGTGVFTSGLSGKGSAKNFTSDNSAYIVSQNADGEAEIKVESHEHDGVSFTKWTSTNSLPTEAGNYYLTGDVTISSTWNVPSGETKLCLNGHAIIRTNAEGTTGSAIQVGSGATLNLYDCGTETRYYTVANPAVNGAGLGTVVDKSAYDAAGENARGTFIGGYITGGNITGGADAYHLIGGGVNVDKGSFTMNGGTIIGNKVCINGGGVKVKGAGASFTMNGGAILANYNDCYGGAISVGDNDNSRLCTVTINGGTIAYNWSGRNGGAIHPDGKGHTINISGGSIVNNYTNGNYDNGSAGRSGGGVLKDGGNFKISGDPVIMNNLQGSNAQNNLYVFRNSDVPILAGLTSGADIGMYFKGLTSSSDVKLATGAQKEDMQYLHFDIPSEGTLIYCDGTKDWIYKNGELVEFTEEVHHTHETGTVWATAYVPHEHDNIKFTKWTATDSLPNTAGNYRLASDVTISSTWNVPSGTTNLCLDGHKITMTGSGSVISVDSGATLVIYDDEENKGVISGGNVTEGGGAITVNAASLVLNGGVISGNKTTGTGQGKSAGAIYLKNSASFLMNDGEISGNSSASQGGAICTDQTNTTVDIAGGVIKNNTAAHWASAVWAGRSSGAQLIIRNDAKIIDNISLDGSGTVNVADTQNYLMSGDPTIYGKSSSGSGLNTHLNFDGNNSGFQQKIELTGPMTNDTGDPKITICAYHNTLSSNVTFVFTKNWSTYMGSANPANYFKLDSSVTGLKIVRKNGEAAIASSGDKYIFFDANGGTGSMDSQLAASGDTKLNSNEFTRENYIFASWNTKADGSGTKYADGASVTLSGDLTLYAQWKKDQFEGEGTEDKPYLIQSAADWNALSEHINSGGTKYAGCYFKLTEDISVSTVLGNRPNSSTDSADNVFSGTFDGDGHTLDVNISDPGFAAPFAVAHNATIKNLHVTGTITSTANHAAGVVAASKDRTGYASSSLVIQNVTVSADISCNSHVAGIVGHAHKADITMENVVFDGSISASSVQGGFIGWGGIKNGEKYSSTFKDCVFAGTYREGVAFCPVAFASGQGTATLVNDFYTSDKGSGGSPIQTSGSGQLKLFAATVEKDGAVKYFDSFVTAADGANWTDGSTLKLMDDVSYDSKIDIPAGKRVLDLNGKTLNESSNAGFRIGKGSSAIADVTIIDNIGSGKIRHDSSRAGSLIWIKEGSSLTLNGGMLEANSTAAPVIDFFQQKNASFTMNGGKITGYANNGAVRFGANCVFNMRGGEISGLETSTGVFDYSFDSGSVINISGDPVVQNNTVNGTVTNFNLPDGKVINVDGKLNDGALIGVTMAKPGVFTSGLSGKGTENCFTSDNSNFIIAMQNGEACLNNKILDVTASGYEGDYDGNAHSITVSVPEGATVKYGTEEGSYTLTNNPSYTDAGTYTVYYEVSKEGFDPAVGSATVKIDKVDAAITTAPLAKELIADGTAQELITAGAANGGTVYYAISRDNSASPADGEYKAELPKATDAGAYYVWYLVKGDKNHNDLAPDYVKVTLAEEDWVIISGTVYDSSKTPVANVTVNLTQGSKVVDKINTDATGEYYFKVPTGLYNLVVKTDNSTTTYKGDISESMTYDIDLLKAGTESVLDVVDSDKDVVVDGLNDEAQAVREGDNVPAEQNVSVKLTVKAVSADGTEGAKKIAENAPDKNLEYYDLKVEKSVASEVTTIEETQNVLELAIPCSFTNKRELVAYDYSGSGVKTLTESSSGEAGTFRVDKSKKIMYVYLNHFSTIGVGYKPYYRVKSSVKLGSFNGNVSVTLKKEGSDEKYVLNDISLDSVSFTDISKGSYQMTITWKDGVQHTLTLPVTIK